MRYWSDHIVELDDRPIVVGYQVGYRTTGIGGYVTPYTDLPITQLGEAQLLLRKLMNDFPTAEWRMVEVWS